MGVESEFTAQENGSDLAFPASCPLGWKACLPSELSLSGGVGLVGRDWSLIL